MRALLTIALSLTAGAAVAHPATAPHAHPHGPSFLPDAFALSIAAALVLGGLAAWRLFHRR